MKVWLLTIGDGSDGNEWSVESIHASRESAERARQVICVKFRADGASYTEEYNIEEWEVEECLTK